MYTRSGLGLKKEFIVLKTVTDQFTSEDEQAFATGSFYPQDALSIMRNIPDDGLAKLGFSKNKRGSRPENFIIEVLLCPPTVMRPSIASTESSRTRGHGDLTLKLQDIVKTNNNLRDEMTNGVKSNHFDRIFEQLQVHLAVYLLNDSKYAQKPTGVRSVSIRSISARLKGKKGRIRGNLCGKRVDFSSKSVVSSDACIDLDQVGVPKCIAQKQTIPDKVTNFNMSSLKDKILKRECNSIIKKPKSEYQTGQEIKVMYLDDEMLIEIGQSLEIGDIVERHLMNDDIVLFNRQPSLHAFS